MKSHLARGAVTALTAGMLAVTAAPQAAASGAADTARTRDVSAVSGTTTGNAASSKKGLPPAMQASQFVTGGQSVQLQRCRSGPYRAKIKLAKRSGPGRSYHFKGWLAKNKRICIDKGVSHRGYYPNCGGGRDWARIAGTKSWVAAKCLRWDR